MKQNLTIFLLIGLFSTSLGQNTDNSFTELSFQEKLNQCNIVFSQPANFKETAVIENRDQYYDYAIKHKDMKVEIRYCIRPYDSNIARISREAPQYVWTMFMTTVMNMTHGKRKDFDEYSGEGVKNEFGADWGAITTVKLDCEFGQGYEHAILMTIHKDDIGDIYVFYLCDNIYQLNEKMKDFSNNWFYTMKFKKE